VRMILVPAFMHVVGARIWWAPRALVRLHQRIGISESGPEAVDAGPGSDRTMAASTDGR
jgi:RND superfamily putative drug exporter